MQELFDKIKDLREEKHIETSLSYLEIYNETIRDLLVPGGSKQSLMLREDAHQAVSVAGLTSYKPESVTEVMEIIVRGNEYRTMSPTEANATSSRSHAVLQINVSIKDRNADINEPHTMATLSIIDLAGSERASATKNRGERLLEGANINKSLLALGGCINALCDPRKRNHIPYRNSKLTRLLKFSLGGNCKTVMIVCVSPSSAHFDETQNTLRYANRAKNIQTKVTRNVYNVNRHVKDFLKKIDEQRALIDEFKAREKDSEAVSFAKFRKQMDKHEQISREGITRIRNAYDHSTAERQERLSMMKKLRQIERRISLISSWIAGFDTICEARDEEEPLHNLTAMRKTAKGILTELESSRQHYHQRLAKNNWERALDTALQNGIRQLKEAESGDGSDVSTLIRETELLKSVADREAHTAILDQEKGGDAAIVQVLLQAHFDTIAILGQIMQMSEEDAVHAAQSMLGQLITNCSTAASQVIKPEGGLPVTEVFPPRRRGTPKQRKTATLLGPSPLRAIPRPSFVQEAAPSVNASPMKSSPRRGATFVKGSPRKTVRIGTPKRKTPLRVPKGGVRWRDETDNQTLADYQATPKALDTTPEVSSVDSIPPPPIFSEPAKRSSSSPIPTPPEASTETKARNSRFKTGFLSKRSEGSPLGAPPVSASSLNFSSDSDNSPLREMEMNRVPQPSALNMVHSNNSSDVTPADSAGSSGSEDEASSKPNWPIDQAEAQKIRSALKRSSSNAGGSAMRTQRRRSPTAASATGSPPSENALFSASQARRMGNNSLDASWKASVLSPRSAPVVKSGGGGGMRRTTMSSAGDTRDGGSLRSAPVRMSTSIIPAGAGRSSLMNSKSAWR
jgi:kinesin family protein 18/19